MSLNPSLTIKDSFGDWRDKINRTIDHANSLEKATQEEFEAGADKLATAEQVQSALLGLDVEGTSIAMVIALS